MVRQDLPRDVLFRVVMGRQNGDAVVDLQQTVVARTPEVGQSVVEVERRRLMPRRIEIGRGPRRTPVHGMGRVPAQGGGFADRNIPLVRRNRRVIVVSGSDFIGKGDFNTAAGVGIDPRFPGDRAPVFVGSNRVIVAEAQAFVE